MLHAAIQCHMLHARYSQRQRKNALDYSRRMDAVDPVAIVNMYEVIYLVGWKRMECNRLITFTGCFACLWECGKCA